MVKKQNIEQIEKYAIFIGVPILIVISVIVFLLKISSPIVIFGLSFALMALLLPYFLIKYLAFAHLKKVEEIYPNFLRDLTEAIASGMTIPQAISTISQTEYGELTQHLKRLSASLAWGTPFPDAWKMYTSSFEGSEFLIRINDVILESFMSGGDIIPVLNSLAEDVSKIKKVQDDKKVAMFQHLAVMYVVYAIFLGIIIMLYKILLPLLYLQRFGAFAGMSFRPSEVLSIDYFKNLFFLMAVIQSGCLGVMAGQITEEKLIAGFKHVIIMLGVTFIVFGFTILPTKLSFEVEVSPQTAGIGQVVSISGQVYFEGTPVGGAEIQLVGPSGESLTLVTDSLGQFSTNFIAPTQSGEYAISVTLIYRGETTTIVKKLIVG